MSSYLTMQHECLVVSCRRLYYCILLRLLHHRPSCGLFVFPWAAQTYRLWAHANACEIDSCLTLSKHLPWDAHYVLLGFGGKDFLLVSVIQV